jgi:hypothetical protein
VEIRWNLLRLLILQNFIKNNKICIITYSNCPKIQLNNRIFESEIQIFNQIRQIFIVENRKFQWFDIPIYSNIWFHSYYQLEISLIQEQLTFLILNLKVLNFLYPLQPMFAVSQLYSYDCIISCSCICSSWKDMFPFGRKQANFPRTSNNQFNQVHHIKAWMSIIPLIFFSLFKAHGTVCGLVVPIADQPKIPIKITLHTLCCHHTKNNNQ